MVLFYKKWKMYNEIQLTKNKMDLNNRKITNHPPSHVNLVLQIYSFLPWKTSEIFSTSNVVKGTMNCMPCHIYHWWIPSLYLWTFPTPSPHSGQWRNLFNNEESTHINIKLKGYWNKETSFKSIFVLLKGRNCKKIIYIITKAFRGHKMQKHLT